MTKTYTEKEFNDVLTSALMHLVNEAKEHNCMTAATEIMMIGAPILSEIRKSVFDDNTDMITIEKE